MQLHTKEGLFGELPENPGNISVIPNNPSKSVIYKHIISDDPDKIMPPLDSKLSLNSYEKKLINHGVSKWERGEWYQENENSSQSQNEHQIDQSNKHLSNPTIDQSDLLLDHSSVSTRNSSRKHKIHVNPRSTITRKQAKDKELVNGHNEVRLFYDMNMKKLKNYVN